MGGKTKMNDMIEDYERQIKYLENQITGITHDLATKAMRDVDRAKLLYKRSALTDWIYELKCSVGDMKKHSDPNERKKISPA